MRIADPDRIFVDISDSRLSDDFQNGYIAVKAELVKRIRVAQNRPGVVRVVFNTSATADYKISQLQDPHQIVVDLFTSNAGKTGANRSSVPSASLPVAAKRTAPLAAAAMIRPANSENGKAPVAAGSMAIASERNDPAPVLLASPAASAKEVAASAAEGSEPPAPASTADVVMIEPSPENQMGIIPSVDPTTGNLKRVTTSSELVKLPLTVNGTLSSGYYSSFTRGGGNEDQRVSFVPTGAVFDMNGYYMNPDMLEYSIRSELNTGAQASDAGIEGGNGLRLNVTTFRHGFLPTSFRYSNLQLKDAYFGSLTQVSSYTLKNRMKDLGFTASLKAAGLPNAILDWGTSSVRSQSYNPGMPDYDSRSAHLNLNCSDQRWGWDFQCFMGRQRLTSDLFTPADASVDSSPLRQRVTEYRGSARRTFGGDSELYVDGGNQYTSNVVLNRPIDLTTRYASVNLRMFQRRKWKASMRVGYTSNISGLVLTQLVGGLAANGSVAPDANVLQRFQHTTSYLNLNGLTSVDLSKGFGLYGSLDRTAVLTASQDGLNSKYLTTAGGVTYSRSFRWGSLSGQYGRSFGLGSITGQAGRILGQTYAIAVQPGRPDGLLFDFSVRGSDQDIHNDAPVREHIFGSDIGVGFPLVDRLRLRLGGGWQKSVFSNQGNDFSTSGYTARLGIEHPRFQLNGSVNSDISNSLQTYSQLVNGMGVGSALLTPLRIIPSDLRGITVSVRVVPMQKLEFSALFTRSVQHLEGIVANDFEVFDVYATYHFRKIQIVAGYFGSAQIYSSLIATYPRTERGRFYVRILRPIKVL